MMHRAILRITILSLVLGLTLPTSPMIRAQEYDPAIDNYDPADDVLSDEELIQKYLREEDLGDVEIDDYGSDDPYGTYTEPDEDPYEDPDASLGNAEEVPTDPVEDPGDENPGNSEDPEESDDASLPRSPARDSNRESTETFAIPDPAQIPDPPYQERPGRPVKGRRILERIVEALQRDAAFHGGFLYVHDDHQDRTYRLSHREAVGPATLIEGLPARTRIKQATDANVIEPLARPDARVYFSRHRCVPAAGEPVILDVWSVADGPEMRLLAARIRKFGESVLVVYKDDWPFDRR